VSDTNEMGIPVVDSHPALTTDVYKELINKIAWAIGSVYRVPYRNKKEPARDHAQEFANDLIAAVGYPRHIGR